MTITLNGTTGITSTGITETSDGKVGIGTSSHYDASTKLTVAGRINTSNGTAIGSMNYGGGAVVNIGSLSNHPVQLMTNNTTRVVVDSAGRVTMPYQPCFTATNFSNTYGSGVLVLPDTLTNVGGHYSTSTGRFTAPVNGKYHISFMAIPGSSTNVSMIIRKNGVDQFPFGYMASDNNDTGAIVAIHSLLAGDYVEIWASGNVETGYVSFTGFLLG